MEGTPGGPYRPPEGQPGGTGAPAPGPYEGAYPAPPPGGGYPQQPPYGGQPPYQGQQQQGPSAAERATDVMHSVERRWRTQETKPFYRTSEFLVWAVTAIAIMIAGLVVDDGDALGPTLVWTLVTVLSFAYIVSRGISKAGTKYGDHDRDRR